MTAPSAPPPTAAAVERLRAAAASGWREMVFAEDLKLVLDQLDAQAKALDAARVKWDDPSECWAQAMFLAQQKLGDPSVGVSVGDSVTVHHTSRGHVVFGLPVEFNIRTALGPAALGSSTPTLAPSAPAAGGEAVDGREAARRQFSAILKEQRNAPQEVKPAIPRRQLAMLEDIAEQMPQRGPAEVRAAILRKGLVVEKGGVLFMAAAGARALGREDWAKNIEAASDRTALRQPAPPASRTPPEAGAAPVAEQRCAHGFLDPYWCPECPATPPEAP